MNREFLDLYNTELQLLNEQAREFADEYPGIAERLGGILEDRVDPLIGGLLEGAAFLAARVQLKLKHEFPEFTENLLEQLVPHYLAPTPSMMLVKANPIFGDPALREGRAIPRGSYLDASFRQLDRQIACRYRLCGDITVWPFELVGAEYYPSPPRCRRSECRRRRGAGGLANNLDTSLDGATRRRTFRSRRAQEAGAHACRLPDLRSAVVFHWRGGGCGRPVRAAVCPLSRSLLPPPRSVRRSGRSSAPQAAFSRSALIATMRCFPPITGSSKVSICCANISSFRANFSAATSRASMTSFPESRRRPSTSCLPSTKSMRGSRPPCGRRHLRSMRRQPSICSRRRPTAFR